jgi:hypothetical protein
VAQDLCVGCVAPYPLLNKDRIRQRKQKGEIFRLFAESIFIELLFVGLLFAFLNYFLSSYFLKVLHEISLSENICS